MAFTKSSNIFLSTALLGSLSICAAAEMGSWTNGLNGSSVPLAEAVLVVGSVLAALSLLLLVFALLDLIGVVLRPRWCGEAVYPIMHIGLAVLWLPVIGISGFLLNKEHYAAIGFVAAGGICVLLHVSIALTQLCWWYCARVSLASLGDHPKSALLTAPSVDPHRPPGGFPGAPPQSGGGPPGANGAGAPGHNPFRATYGLLPGSSNVFAYHIFISEEDNRPYAGLQSGPQRLTAPAAHDRSRKQIQPLISLQSTGQLQQLQLQQQPLQPLHEQEEQEPAAVQPPPSPPRQQPLPHHLLKLQQQQELKQQHKQLHTGQGSTEGDGGL